jgi:selenide, water dikinase
VLRPLQNLFDPADTPNLMVGLGVPDDAAVYRLDDERALIFTTDFFTPVVDDPYAYGAIAAANALSDIYAMGGEPLLALNLVAFPPDLPPHILSEVLRGGAEKVREAKAVLGGGHTIQDKEPKYGLAVIGMAHPDRLTTKGGAKPGDMLILTKPLGTGVITTATKRDLVEQAHLAEATRWMSMLNRAAAEASIASGTRAMTDITGFGFIGHASEMANASDVTLEIDYAKVPFMDGAPEYAKQWIFPGGSTNNRKAFEAIVSAGEGFREEEIMLLYDAQTSGGLLISLPVEHLNLFAGEMDQRDALWWQVGRVTAPGEKRIVVIQTS